jgi:hypothetical protein
LPVALDLLPPLRACKLRPSKLGFKVRTLLDSAAVSSKHRAYVQVSSQIADMSRKCSLLCITKRSAARGNFGKRHTIIADFTVTERATNTVTTKSAT